MESLLIKLLEDLNSSVLTLVTILLVVFWLVYKAGKMSESFGLFKSKNEKMDGNIDKIKENLATIKATTDLLYQAHVSTVKTQSPLSLTQKGIDIAEKLKIEKMIDSHWDLIRDEFDKMEPIDNPYDIQVGAIDISRFCFEQIFNSKEKSQIKRHAFEIGLNLLEIYPIIGVKIRDRILKEKGIDLKEIDKHDPKKKSD